MPFLFKMFIKEHIFHALCLQICIASLMVFFEILFVFVRLLINPLTQTLEHAANLKKKKKTENGMRNLKYNSFFYFYFLYVGILGKST